MELHKLSFAKVIVIDQHVAEVIVNDGVEMTDEMVTEYHQFLLEHFTAPIKLLVNKINSYAYDFNAQLNLANLPEISAMAVVVYSRISEMATENLASNTLREEKWNIQIFNQRDEALHWLNGQ